LFDYYAQQCTLVPLQSPLFACPGSTIAVYFDLCNYNACAETFTWTAQAPGQGADITVVPQPPLTVPVAANGCELVTALVTIGPNFIGTFNVEFTGTSMSDGVCGSAVTLTCTRATTVTVVTVDVDVDSDNTNNVSDFGPQRNQTEESIEDDPLLPGKYVTVNDDSDDRDVISDYGDGYNLDGMAGTSDDANIAENNFVRVVLEVPAPVNLDVAMLRFTYDGASDPAAATVAGDPPVVTPGPGRLRIWKKTGTAIRNPASIGATPPGDYVPPGTYAAALLGLSDTTRAVPLWIEGIRPSPSLGADRIFVELDPDGAGPQGFLCSDAVRVTVIGIDLDIDSDNTNGTQAPDRSPTEDVVEDLLGGPRKFVRVNRDNDDDPEPYYASPTVHERIDDFGDGYNRDGVAGNDDDVNAAENDFIRLVLEVPAPIDLNFARLIFSYSASDPAALTISDAAPQYNAPNRRQLTPAPGNLRVWTRPGTDARNSGSVILGAGHFVPSSSPPVPIEASELGLSNTTRMVTLYVEGIAASSGAGQQRILVALDPDGNGAAGAIVSDAVRSTVLDVQFTAVEPNKGFDHTINPRGLMVPLPAGLTNNSKVTISPSVDVKFRSSDVTVVVVPAGPQNGEFVLGATSVGAGPALVQAYIDTADQPVVGELRARVLPNKDMQVKFHQVSDTAGGGYPAHMSARGAAQAQALLDAMNAIWNPQANIFFRGLGSGTAADFVVDPVIAVNLGPVVQFYDGGGPPPAPCTQSAGADVMQVNANQDPAVPYDVFFVWEYEQDCPPDEDVTMNNTAAATGGGTTKIDDVTCDDASTLSHEAGHQINPMQVHFSHVYAGNPNPDPNCDCLLHHNLMSTVCAPTELHITLRQANISNDATP
jgi:hypothetical protein